MYSYKKTQPCVELGNPWFHPDNTLRPKTLDGSLRRNLQESPKSLLLHSRGMGRSSMGGGAIGEQYGSDDLYRSTSTVLLPACTIGMGQTYGLDAEGLAKHAAEWALLSGNSDTVSVVPERQDLSTLPPTSARVANSPEPALMCSAKVERTRPEGMARVY